ncbi:hypothetical protein [Prosthecochloris sp. SCSIO W1103]|uniref:hypothetical protein n=1 Tax=Prosthecochloris sp. SCSIO W1103 TaxID=2992244 RepID=UPI00223E6E77|nr:hypothetical protein [Prosthecochloris sp. SCSIO W1103]UZJ36457.1 hypothetical protein OO005_06715 [Prosthecochloris sp. SCSIO W1103]
MIKSIQKKLGESKFLDWLLLIIVPLGIWFYSSYSTLRAEGLLYDLPVDQQSAINSIDEYAADIKSLDASQNYVYGVTRNRNGAVEDRLIVRTLISEERRNSPLRGFVIPGFCVLLCGIGGVYTTIRFSLGESHTYTVLAFEVALVGNLICFLIVFPWSEAIKIIK